MFTKIISPPVVGVHGRIVQPEFDGVELPRLGLGKIRQVAGRIVTGQVGDDAPADAGQLLAVGHLVETLSGGIGQTLEPLPGEAVRDAMPVLFDLLEKEPEPAVRAVLGHWTDPEHDMLGERSPASFCGYTVAAERATR